MLPSSRRGKYPPVRRKEGRPGCPARVVVATWYGEDSPHLSWNAPRYQARLVKTVNIRVGWAANSPWTRPLAPVCGDTLKELRLGLGWGIVLEDSSRVYRLGHRPVALLCWQSDESGWMYCQAHARRMGPLRRAELRRWRSLRVERWSPPGCASNGRVRPMSSPKIASGDVGETDLRLLERRWQQRVVGCMDRFHKIHCIEWETTGWIYLVREEADEETNDLKTRQCVARYVEVYVWCIETQRKATFWVIEKPKLDNARKLRGIFFIEPGDEEFKRTMKNARRKLAIPMPAATLCWLQLHQRPETCGTVGQHKTKYACIAEANESLRIRMEGSQSKNHEEHIAGKGMNSLSHYNLVYKFIPMPEAMKVPDAKAAVEKEWENWRKCRHGSWRRSKTNVRWSMKQGLRAILLIFWVLGSLSISKIRSWSFKNTKVESYSQVAGSYAVVTEQGSSASQMTAAKVMDIISRLSGCAGQAADAVSAYTQVKKGRRTIMVKNSKVRMSRYLDYVYQNTNGLNHGPVWKIQSFHLNEICTVILFAGLLWKMQF